MLASFLLVRKVDPSQSFPLETATEIANSRAKGKANSKSKKSDKKKKAEDDKAKGDEKTNGQGDQPGTPANPEQTTTAGQNEKTPDTANQQGEKTDIKSEEPSKENPANLKEYYQPVTFHFQSPNPKVLEPLARVVKPPDEVRRYMNEVMDRAERAPDEFLAMRLPHEGVDQSQTQQDNEGGKKGTTAMHRSRPSRANKVALLEQDDTDAETSNTVGEDAEEEELADFYGAPTGIGFW